MMDNREDKLFKELDRLAFISSTFLIVVLIVIYFVVAQSTPTSVIREFILAIITNLIPVLIIFVISYVLLRHFQEIRSEKDTNNLIEQMSKRLEALFSQHQGRSQIAEICYEVFDEIPWENLFSTARKIDICAQYLNSWIDNKADLIQRFFDNGGEIRVFLPNYRNEPLVKIIKEGLPDYNEEQIKKKIENTYNKFAEILARANHKEARVEGYLIDSYLLYCGIRFDNRVVAFGLYEHTRRNRVADPAFVVDLSNFPKIQRWFENEISRLTDQAVDRLKPNNNNKHRRNGFPLPFLKDS